MHGYCADRHKLVSVDVFDTLLLRDRFSERRRFWRIARATARALAEAGHARPVDAVFAARETAQTLAYAALRATDPAGDVKFRDILRGQLLALGLGESLVETVAAAELGADGATLRLNTALLSRLRTLRAAGVRVALVSDTYYSADDLMALLRERGAQDAADRIYASADHNATKKGGRLFPLVAASEGVEPAAVFHMGDDATADVEAPRARGSTALCLPRARPVRLARKADAAWMRAAALATPGRAIADADTPAAFGERVLGPILAEYALRLFVYANALPRDSQLLFCARGGLRLRVCYERFLARIGRTSPLPYDDLMVSRLAAARAPLLQRARPAVEEMSREFEGASMGEALAALTQRPHEASPAWTRPFEIQAFLDLIAAPDPVTTLAREAIAQQGALFAQHLAAVAKASHLVLCDTGLYGSTLRLIEAAHPHLSLSCALFARANYKGFATDHFARTVGLAVERDAYSPFDLRSVALRYWHLVEYVCEPDLASVKTFARDEAGVVRANLERPGWREALAPADGGFFAGALAYFERLAPGTYGERIARDAPLAWQALRRRILWPSPADRALLDVGARGRDFGRAESVPALDADSGFSLAALRSSLWREGAAAQAPFGLRPLVQAGLETAQILKPFRRRATQPMGAASP